MTKLEQIKDDEQDVTITIPKGIAKDILFNMETAFFETIRNDEEVDNIMWVRAWLDAYDEIAHAVGRCDSRGQE